MTTSCGTSAPALQTKEVNIGTIVRFDTHGNFWAGPSYQGLFGVTIKKWRYTVPLGTSVIFCLNPSTSQPTATICEKGFQFEDGTLLTFEEAKRQFPKGFAVSQLTTAH